MLTIHEYPTTGQAPAAISLIRVFAATGKPVLLGETFMLSDDLPTQREFLTGASPHLAGSFEFFNGSDPRVMAVHDLSDSIYQASLGQFISLRHGLTVTYRAKMSLDASSA
jgi:hypothetical protein